MKKQITTLVTMLLLTVTAFGQGFFSNQASYGSPANAPYVPRNMELEMKAMEAEYTLKSKLWERRNELLGWISDLKEEIKEDLFISNMNYYENMLNRMTIYEVAEEPNLSLLTKGIINDIKKERDEYDNRINVLEENEKKYYNDKNYSMAIAEANKILKLEQQNPSALLYRGLSNAELKDFNSAIKDFSAIISLYPEHPNAYVNRGSCFMDLKDYNNALKDFEKAISLNTPNNLNSSIGRCYIELKNYNKAIEYYNSEILQNPNNAFAYCDRAYAKENLSDYFGAIADCSKAIEITPDSPYGYLGRARGKLKIKDLQGAMTDITKAIGFDNKISGSYRTRGEILFEMNKYSLAEKDLKQAIELDIKNDKACFLLGRVNYKLGKKKEACEYWRTAGDLGNTEVYSYITKYCQ